ncbi:MAG TPA: ABC transporter permease [Arsenicitalea sp.]|nr:ABC transporter permease [Arsenicitalea sp.]
MEAADTIEPGEWTEEVASPAETFVALRALGRDPVAMFCVFALGVLALIAIFAPLLAPYDPLTQSITKANLLPSAQHWIGTDKFGRDILARIIYGARTSLLLGVTAPLLAGIAGTLLGVTAGYFGGWIDRIIGRLVDLLLAFPALLLGIMISASLGPGFWELVATLSIAFAPRFARIARASTLSLRNEPFIEAATVSGLGHGMIIARHVVPNIFGPIIVVLTLEVASAIRLEATLSFLGLGTQAPQPSWGNIIRDGLDNVFGSPWPIISAGLAITITTLAINLIGDAVRDVLDPETRG